MDLIVGALLMVLVALYLVGVKEKCRGADFEVLGRAGLADALFFVQLLHVCLHQSERFKIRHHVWAGLFGPVVIDVQGDEENQDAEQINGEENTC